MNLDTPYWEIANQFLFYSGHDLAQPIDDPAKFREGLRQGRWALLKAPPVGPLTLRPYVSFE